MNEYQLVAREFAKLLYLDGRWNFLSGSYSDEAPLVPPDWKPKAALKFGPFYECGHYDIYSCDIVGILKEFKNAVRRNSAIRRQ